MHVFRLKNVTFEALWCQNEFGEGMIDEKRYFVQTYYLSSQGEMFCFTPCFSLSSLTQKFDQTTLREMYTTNTKSEKYLRIFQRFRLVKFIEKIKTRVKNLEIEKIIAFDKYLHELFFAFHFHLNKNLFLTLKIIKLLI